ncbi:MAG TPA: hypothetical protein VIM90_12360 [Arenimonas sp.]
MEFHIQSAATDVELRRFRNDVIAVDPAAMVERDALGQHLLASTQLSGSELLTIASLAGLQITREHLQAQPSVCCGGCGG